MTTAATAAAARATATRVEAKTRSIELAQARGYHCQGPARSVGIELDEVGRLISLTLRIPSASSAAVYTLVYVLAHDDAHGCTCPSATHGRPCWHRGVAVAGGRWIAHLAATGWRD